MTERLWSMYRGGGRALATCLLLFSAASIGSAQQTPRGVTYPSADYYAALQVYREGRLADAVRGFEAALRRGRSDIGGKWIDSIPASTMLGECYYQLGDIQQAHQYFDAALRLMLQHDGWLHRVQWPQTINQSGGTPALPNWVAGLNRPLRPAGIPQTMTLAVGQQDATQALQSGGVFQAPQLLPVDVAEILRCLGWALYRRNDLLGVFAVDDPLVEQLSARLRAVRLPADGWPTVWIQLLDGLALIADGQPQQAIPRLQQGRLLPGGLDHPLTPLAGVALGRLMHELGNSGMPADRLLNEALVGAIVEDQNEVIVEIFRVSTGHAAATGTRGLATQAIGLAASQGRRERLIGSAALLCGAEIAAANGKPDEGMARLADLKSLLGRRGFSQPRIQAQAEYVRALCASQQGDYAAAGTAIESVMRFAQAGQFGIGSSRVYQLRLLDAGLASGSIGNRRGDELTRELLGPPTALAWRRSAIDALAAQSVDVSAFHQTQLGRSWGQLKPEQLVEQVDRMLREQFRRAVALGGRAVDLRWLASAPAGWLSAEARQQKENPPAGLKNFLEAGTQLVSLAQQRAEAAIQPAAEQAAEVEQLEARLWAVADTMERGALTHALRRHAFPEVFPPPLVASDLNAPQAADAAVLAFCPTAGGIKGLWLHGGKVDTWDVGQPAAVGRSVAKLLKAIGVGPTKADVPRLPEDAAWQAEASALASAVAPPLTDGRIDDVQRLVVVPYGPLWLLPFEVLPVSGPGERRVADRMITTYAPTLGLAFHPVPRLSTATSTAGLVNRFFHPQDGDKETAARDNLLDAANDALLLAAKNAIVGRRAKVLARTLWIANANTPNAAQVFNYSPLYYDRSRSGGVLSDWMRLPLVASELVLLPGTDFTSAESFTVAGNTIFLTACSLHAAGIRHVVLSRWAVRGESTRQLLEETLKEAAVGDAAEAWRRAVLLVRSTQLTTEDEPSLTAGDRERWEVPGDAPFFWSGYISLGGVNSR